MKKSKAIFRFTLLVLQTATCINAHTQDKNVLAKALYLKAEEAYSSQHFPEAEKKIAEVEEITGENPRTLFLKINIYNKYSDTSEFYYGKTNQAIKRFFSIVDANNYPEEKYLEIVNLSIDIKDRKQRPTTQHNSTKIEYKCASKKGNIFDDNDELTMLGLDFSTTQFSGTLLDRKGKLITDNSKIFKYIEEWNSKEYIGDYRRRGSDNSLGWVFHRKKSSINFEIKVTKESNALNRKDYLANLAKTPFQIDESLISKLINQYKFQSKFGIGIIIFVESVDLNSKMMSVWVSFVDMREKCLIYTIRQQSNLSGKELADNFWSGSQDLLLKIHDSWEIWRNM